MRLFLDACVLVSLFEKDKYTESAEGIFIDILEGKSDAYISYLVFVEVCGVLRRKAGKEQAKIALKKVEEWLSKGILTFVGVDENCANAACFLAIEYGLKGADALISASAREHKLKFVTFDNELKERLHAELDFYKAG